MRILLTFYPEEVLISVRMPMDEYAKAIKAVPIPGSDVQGLEHSGDDLLFRLGRMKEALEFEAGK